MAECSTGPECGQNYKPGAQATRELGRSEGVGRPGGSLYDTAFGISIYLRGLPVSTGVDAGRARCRTDQRDEPDLQRIPGTPPIGITAAAFAHSAVQRCSPAGSHTIVQRCSPAGSQNVPLAFGTATPVAYQSPLTC